jgi:hypothetical protein
MTYGAVPNTLTNGNPADATQVMANFQYLEDINMPIGAVIAWHKSLSGVPALTSKWVECNGQTLSDAGSPLNGQVIPNLNSTGYFLRGSTTSGTLQAESVNGTGLTTDISHTHGTSSVSGTVGGSDGTHTHTITDPGHIHGLGNNEGYGGNPAVMTGQDLNQQSPQLIDSNTTGITINSTNSAHGHSHSLTAAGQSLASTSKALAGAGTETRPKNMSVVWIMRVK